MKDNKVNPKMLLTKDELANLTKEVKENYTGVSNHHRIVREGFELKDNRVPEYYKGKNGYEARKVCDNFELPYHLATATTYILRAYHKHDTPIDCITKAIAHLEFELEKIQGVA